MARKSNKDNSFADLVRRLNEMSNMTPEQERAELMEAARNEPKILDSKDVSLGDIAKLAGIKEYTEAPKVSLKQEEKEEATLDADAFKETFIKEITEYVKEAEADKLAELYNAFSTNEVEVKEDSFLIKTPETTEIIADAEQAEEEVVQEKETEEEQTDEASGYEGGDEARKHTVTLAGDFTAEEPVTEKDAESIEKMLQDAGIPAEVNLNPEAYDKVNVATMADKDAILKVLGDMVEENMDVEYSDDLTEAKKKPVPTSPDKWSRAKAKARSKFDVYPSAYANAYAAKEYKKMGGGWRMGKPKKKK